MKGAPPLDVDPLDRPDARVQVVLRQRLGDLRARHDLGGSARDGDAVVENVDRRDLPSDAVAFPATTTLAQAA
jgi:hypothetical protein